MAETIKSMVEEALELWLPVDRQRLIDDGVYLQVISALNETDEHGGATLPVQNNLNERDLEEPIEDEKIRDVRAIVGRVFQKIADNEYSDTEATTPAWSQRQKIKDL